MSESITQLFSYSILFSHIIFVFLLLAIVFKGSWGREIVLFVGKYALLFGFILSLFALIGSLIYSNVIGFLPCELCWWQRICLYPETVLFLVAMLKKDRNIFTYIISLASIATLIALYHTYIQLGGETSILPCTAVGAACTKVFVLTFGYITIPTMSLTIALYLLLLAYFNHIYKKI